MKRLQTRQPLLTETQLDRRLRRVELKLAWFAGLLLGNLAAQRWRGWRGVTAWLWTVFRCERWVEAQLKRLAHYFAMIVLARATLVARPRRRSHGGRARNVPPGFARRMSHAGILRATLGSRLRRRLRARGAAARIAALAAALRDVDTLVADMARRLARGLTRFFALRAVRPPHDALRALLAPTPPCVDSS